MIDLSILICTVPYRTEELEKLLKVLMPQVEKFEGRIEVLALWNQGHHTLNHYRRALLAEAKGRYICYVDDDDVVASYYCSQIIKNMGKDYIGFRVQLTNEGVVRKPAYHSIKHDHWYEDGSGYYRGITHLNPIKREIAIQGDWGPDRREAGEDAIWAKSLAPLVKSENYIDKIMYYYQHNMEKSLFSGSATHNRTNNNKLEVDSPYFRYVDTP